MGLWMLEVLGISLILTLILELLFALAVGIRTKKDLLLVILVNIMTNPALVLCFYIIFFYTNWNPHIVKLLLEIIAFIVEARYYKLYLNLQHPVLFSFLANLISFGAGIILSGLPVFSF